MTLLYRVRKLNHDLVFQKNYLYNLTWRETSHPKGLKVGLKLKTLRGDKKLPGDK